MFEIILLFLIFLFLLGIIVLIAVYGNWFIKKNNAAAEAFAAKYHLSVDQPKNRWFGYPKIFGEYGGYEMRIITFKNKTSYDMHDLFTEIRMDTDNCGDFAFTVFEKNFLSRLHPAFCSFGEWKIGDADFDHRLIVKTNDIDKVKNILSGALSTQILSLTGTQVFFNLSFDGMTLTCRRQGTLVSELVTASLDAMLPLMANVAGKLINYAETERDDKTEY